jgi:hypothetical protein
MQGLQNAWISMETNDCWLLQLDESASDGSLRLKWMKLELATATIDDYTSPLPVVHGVDQTLDLAPGSATTYVVFGGDRNWDQVRPEEFRMVEVDGHVQILDLLGLTSIVKHDLVAMG